jgi:hypothetical protein
LFWIKEQGTKSNDDFSLMFIITFFLKIISSNVVHVLVISYSWPLPVNIQQIKANKQRNQTSKSDFRHQTSYIRHHTSYIILQTSDIILHTSYIILQTSDIILHTSYFIHHTSYIILQTSDIILHTSDFIHQTSYFIQTFLRCRQPDKGQPLTDNSQSRYLKMFPKIWI